MNLTLSKWTIPFWQGKYTVTHRNSTIGTLEVWDGKPDSVKIIRSYENKAYTVKFLGPKDIIVSKKYLRSICYMHHESWFTNISYLKNTQQLSRSNRINENICKIHAAEPLSKTCLVFESSLVFSDPSLTSIEACLAISLAVVFVSLKNIYIYGNLKGRNLYNY